MAKRGFLLWILIIPFPAPMLVLKRAVVRSQSTRICRTLLYDIQWCNLGTGAAGTFQAAVLKEEASPHILRVQKRTWNWDFINSS